MLGTINTSFITYKTDTVINDCLWFLSFMILDHRLAVHSLVNTTLEFYRNVNILIQAQIHRMKFCKNYFQWRRNKKFSAFLHVLEHDLLCKISTQSLWCRPLPFIIDLFLLTVIFLWLLFFAIYLHTFLNFNPWESLNIDHKWNVWFFINLIIDSVLHILIKDLFQSKYFSCRWGRGGGVNSPSGTINVGAGQAPEHFLM